MRPARCRPVSPTRPCRRSDGRAFIVQCLCPLRRSRASCFQPGAAMTDAFPLFSQAPSPFSEAPSPSSEAFARVTFGPISGCIGPNATLHPPESKVTSAPMLLARGLLHMARRLQITAGCLLRMVWGLLRMACRLPTMMERYLGTARWLPNLSGAWGVMPQSLVVRAWNGRAARAWSDGSQKRRPSLSPGRKPSRLTHGAVWVSLL